MYLGGFGIGFGRYVPPIEQLPFIEFYFPGLICTTIMLVSYFETTYPNYSKLNYQKTYLTILLTKITSRQIWFGETLWGCTKSILSIFGLILVASLFGLFNPKVILILPVLFLLAWIFSAFGIWVMSLAKSYDSFIYSTSGLIVPLSLFSGTVFSLNDVPNWVQFLAYLFPLSHAVEICRAVIYKSFTYDLLLNFGVLIVYAGALTYLSLRTFEKRLLN